MGTKATLDDLMRQVEDWESTYEESRETSRIESIYNRATARQLFDMWATGNAIRGISLTQDQFGSFART